MKTALITGASSGIGLALAKVFAEHGYNLVLIARNEKSLLEAKELLERDHGNRGITAHVIAADLTDPKTPDQIFNKTEELELQIDVLVNNAGFAEYGPFNEIELKRELDMVTLNITSLTALTHLFLQLMIRRRAGKILNVASTAAFQPGPLMAVYYATKAYVLSFSEAINHEVKVHGVQVSTLCPGPTKTEFFKKQPGLLGSRLLTIGAKSMTAEEVAKAGYHGLMRGQIVIIPGFRNKILAWSTRFGPRSLITKISAWTLAQKPE